MLTHQDRTILLNALSDSPQFASLRSRQTLVHNALGGYPLSGEADTALRYLDWEGAPIVVADDLIRILEGHEPAPGVPALALVAQAIEPMAGSAHRQRIADLRRRLGWGAVDPSAFPAADWLDQRSPEDLTLERIIGENTLRPVYYLRRALQAADAVVRVDLEGQPHGTGFLVAPNLLLTNHHVIASEAEARTAQAVFFNETPDERARERSRKEVIARTAAANALVYTSAELDVSVVRLRNAPALDHYLPLRDATVKQNSRVAIIQHPSGYPKRIALQNNLVAHANAKIVQYYTSTLAGSSGSPVFDDDFAVVAIHYCWIAQDHPDWSASGRKRPERKNAGDAQYRNQGRSTVAFLEDLRKAAPGILADLTILSE